MRRDDSTGKTNKTSSISDNRPATTISNRLLVAASLAASKTSDCSVPMQTASTVLGLFGGECDPYHSSESRSLSPA